MKLPGAGERKVRELEERLAKTQEPVERLRVLVELAREIWLARPADARQYLEQAVEVSRQTGEQDFLASAANMLGEIHRRAGALVLAEQYANLALEAARAAGSRRKEAGAVNLIGKLRAMHGQYDRAAECFEQCRKLSESEGFLEGAQAALNELGGLFGLRGQPQKALDCYLECLRIDDELGDSYCIALHRYNIGWTLEQLGRWEDAAENLYRAIAVSEQHGYRDLRLDATNVLGELFLKRNSLAKAKDMFQAVVREEREQPGYRQLLQDVLANLGLAHFYGGDLAAAEQTYTEALQMCHESGDRRELALILVRTAELLLARGQLERAEEMLGQAEVLARKLDLKREAAEVLRIRALLAQERGDVAAAAAACEQAMDVLKDVPDSYELARIKFQHGRCLLKSGRQEQAKSLLLEAARAFRQLSIVGEAEEVNRLLFRLEMPSDVEAAVLTGVAGLVRLGLEPVSLFEQVMRIVCEGLEFEGAALFLGEVAVLLHGRPDLDAGVEFCQHKQSAVTDRYAWFPVRTNGSSPGGVFLARAEPKRVGFGASLLDELARRLAEPMRRLAELPLRPEPDAKVPELRYRGVIGRNRVMLENLAVVSQVASASVSVLVKGESGTGKELIARALHDSGTRSAGAFVAVNCAAVPDTLLEAEFFGVEKGAATGIAQRKGKLELASGGTVFLDEVGDMSPALQAKLLRVLQEKTIERLGGSRLIDTDIRVVAATNKNLDSLMREGKFRHDLYYRLNAVEMELPALRERKEDVPAFVRYFITRSNQEYRRNILGADEEVMACLIACDWPGNVRQLLHVIERAVLLSKGPVLSMVDLPQELQRFALEGTGKKTGLRAVRREVERSAAAEVERTMLVQCLEKARGNATEAAKLTGYSRAQFYRLLRKHNITNER